MARSRGVTCLWCARPHATNPARGAPDPRRTRCQRGGLATPLAPSSSPQPTAPASGPGARSCTRHIICRCRHRGLVGGRPAASAPGCRWAAQHTAGQALRRPSRPLAARRPGRRHSLALVCNNVRYDSSQRSADAYGLNPTPKTIPVCRAIMLSRFLMEAPQDCLRPCSRDAESVTHITRLAITSRCS